VCPRHGERGELRLGAPAQQARRLAVHAALEQDVAGREHRAEPHDERGERREQEPEAKAHRSR
jgi:hypothetical protein